LVQKEKHPGLDTEGVENLRNSIGNCKIGLMEKQVAGNLMSVRELDAHTAGDTK